MSLEETNRLRRDSYTLAIYVLEKGLVELDRKRGAYAAAVSSLKRHMADIDAGGPPTTEDEK